VPSDDCSQSVPSVDDAYGLPLAEALVRLVDRSLTDRIETATLAWQRAGRQKNPTLVNKLAGGDGSVVAPHATVTELLAAYRARRDVLVAALRAGDLVMVWRVAPGGGDWDWFRPDDWTALRIGYPGLVGPEMKDDPTPIVIWRGNTRPPGKLSVRVRRVGTAPVSAGPAAEATPKKRGRKEKPYWSAAKSQVMGWLTEDGAAASGDGGQARLVARLSEWLEGRGHNPAKSSVQDHIGKWVEEYRADPEAAARQFSIDRK
jgi:hypothetical protein